MAEELLGCAIANRAKKRLAKQVLTSLTWDFGQEMSAHNFYDGNRHDGLFCGSSSPWQGGSNENTNRLLRQYFPKGKGMAIYSQGQLDEISNKLNTLLRKILRLKIQQKYLNKCCTGRLSLSQLTSRGIIQSCNINMTQERYEVWKKINL